MPAQTAIVMVDAAAANRTFAAAGVKNGVATWLEKTAASVSGFLKVTASMKLPTKQSEPVRHHMKVVLPTVVTETVNGVSYNKVVRQSMADLTVVVSPDATATERSDLMRYVMQMVSKDVNNTINIYNQVYANDETT